MMVCDNGSVEAFAFRSHSICPFDRRGWAYAGESVCRGSTGSLHHLDIRGKIIAGSKGWDAGDEKESEHYGSDSCRYWSIHLLISE